VNAVDWVSVRAQFPALRNWTYLNTATFGQLPRRAVEASVRHFAHRDETACADFLDWYNDADALRAVLAASDPLPLGVGAIVQVHGNPPAEEATEPVPPQAAAAEG